jgi:hypothetical protein|nr:MAG TPA: hypothetical protein [Caudoviricetes sp.]
MFCMTDWKDSPQRSSWVNEWFGCNADDSRKDGKRAASDKG